jgi:hypothetical protein
MGWCLFVNINENDLHYHLYFAMIAQLFPPEGSKREE